MWQVSEQRHRSSEAFPKQRHLYWGREASSNKTLQPNDVITDTIKSIFIEFVIAWENVTSEKRRIQNATIIFFKKHKYMEKSLKYHNT